MLLEKPLVADLTYMTKLFLVALHVIKHSGLVLFSGLARGAHKETRVILGIRKHSGDGDCLLHVLDFNF